MYIQSVKLTSTPTISEDGSLTTVQGTLGIMTIELSFGYGFGGPVAFLEWKQSPDDGLLASLNVHPRKITMPGETRAEAVKAVCEKAVERASELTGLSKEKLLAPIDYYTVDLLPAYTPLAQAVGRVKVSRSMVLFAINHYETVMQSEIGVMIPRKDWGYRGFNNPEAISEHEHYLRNEFGAIMNAHNDSNVQYVWLYAE